MDHTHRHLSRLTLLVAIFAGLAPSLRAADWPQWGGNDPGRNMVSDEKNLPDHFKSRGGETENVRWVATLGNAMEGNPTISGGKVFVGTDDASLAGDPRFSRQKGGMVQCLDEATGKILWRLPVPPRTRDRLPQGAHYGQQNLGVCSSPAVSGKHVYVVTNSCEVLCLDVNGMADGNDGPYQDEAKYMAGKGNKPVKVAKDDGDIIWYFDLIDQAGICPHDVASCSVLVDGRFLYVVSCNGVDAPHAKCLRPDAPSFIVLDSETGKLLATDTEDLGHRMWHCLWSPPSIGIVNGKKLVFFGGADGICYAFNALETIPEKPIHLKKAWQCDCVPQSYRLPGGKPINYYVGDKRKPYTTNRNDGKFLGPSEIISTPVFHDGRVYVTIGQDPTHGRGRGMLTCIDASKSGDLTTGSGILWQYDGLERTIASVSIHDGLLYAVDLAGRLHCLDVATGRLYWMYDTGAECWGTPLIADGKVYLTNKRALVVMAEGKEARLISTSPLAATSYGTPIVANGTLFIASERNLWAVRKAGN